MQDVSKKVDRHMFSIELKSKDYLSRLAMPNGPEDKVLIEGLLGELENVCFVEGLMLEISGSYGSLRIDFAKEELRTLLAKNMKDEVAQLE
jgi:hypothetical protein